MFTTPGTPNLTDYLSFLAGIGIPPAKTPQVFPTDSGAATSGDTGTLQDFTQVWTAQQWLGYSLVDVTQGEIASIGANDFNSLTFAAPVSNPVQLGDQYLIVPDIAPTSLAIAQEIVNPDLGRASATIYTLAVYNLAADRLINYAQDVPGQTFFTDLRKLFRVTDVSVGVPSQASDQGTAVGILNPEQMRLFTLGDLHMLKTPVGRRYLEIAQSIGRTVYGLS
jgi:hypothetical protein